MQIDENYGRDRSAGGSGNNIPVASAFESVGVSNMLIPDECSDAVTDISSNLCSELCADLASNVSTNQCSYESTYG